MDKCREEFEQSPKTKELLSDSIYFDEKENRYKVNADGCLISVVFLNGRWEVWQEQQAKVEELQTHAQEIHKREIKLFEKTLILTHERDELQKRVDKALQEIKGAARWIDEDAIDDADFIRGGVLSALRRLEQALKGEGNA